MPTPTETLMSEHRAIERALDALEVLAKNAENGGRPDRSDVARFAEFFALFADRLHHGKEEDLLFTELQRHGVPAQGGPIAVMLHEHGIGRAYVRELREIGQGRGPIAAEELAKLERAALGYVDLLRSHIQKEDRVLFPMADRILDGPSMASLADRFHSFDDAPAQADARNRMTAAADELTGIYSPRKENV
jgi:hemerythrin-like domain-containing protein